jgi:hypothetical protein
LYSVIYDDADNLEDRNAAKQGTLPPASPNWSIIMKTTLVIASVRNAWIPTSREAIHFFVALANEDGLPWPLRGLAMTGLDECTDAAEQSGESLRNCSRRLFPKIYLWLFFYRNTLLLSGIFQSACQFFVGLPAASRLSSRAIRRRR